MRNARFCRFDKSALWDEIAAEKRLLPELERADRSVSEMKSAYEAIYRRCLAQPIAEDTHPALFNTPNGGCPH
jgi:hypothetical protein